MASNEDANGGFTGAQAMAAQAALRDAAGLPPELFPKEALIGMLSDEIRALRDRGRPDDAIAGVIANATGAAVTADDVERFYVDTRGMPGHPGP